MPFIKWRKSTTENDARTLSTYHSSRFTPHGLCRSRFASPHLARADCLRRAGSVLGRAAHAVLSLAALCRRDVALGRGAAVESPAGQWRAARRQSPDRRVRSPEFSLLSLSV